MIGLFDTLTLAIAKLKTRRIMMFITVVVAGLMFSVLFAAALIITGVLDSITSFDQASNQSFLVHVHSFDYLKQQHLDSFGEDDKQAKTEAEHHYNLYVKEQRDLARQHKIDFDEKSIKHPLKKYKIDKDIRYQYDYDSPVVDRILLERQKQFIAKADNNLSGLKKRAAPFHPLNFYQTTNYRNQIEGLKLIQNNKEDLFNKQGEQFAGAEPSDVSVRESNYRFEESVAMKNLILPANKLRQAHPQAVPVVITATEAHVLFGDKLKIAPVPTDNKQLLQWIEEAQTKLNGQTYQVCYRNPAEQRLLDEALSQHIVQEKTEDQDELPVPKILYNLPTSACGAVTIKQDNRTKDDKKRDEAQIAIAKQQGEHQEPTSEIITFQVVGLFPPINRQLNNGNNLTGLLSHLLNNQLYPGAIVPFDLYRQLPNKAALDQIFFPQAKPNRLADSGQLLRDAGFGAAVVEFGNYRDATNFMDFINGQTMLQQGLNEPGLASLFFGTPQDYYKNKTVDTSQYKFFASTYGRDFATLEVIKKQSKLLVAIAIGIISLIAAVILSLTMARVMSDSRHETAIFRAVGARRGDVAKIYLSYSLIIAGRIILTSLAFGLLISWLINFYFATDLTIQAKLGYGLFNHNLNFQLLGVNLNWLGVLSLSIVVMSLVAVLPPMLRNVVRNPIKDIKDQ